MVRLTHVTGSKQGLVENSPKAVIRFGRASDCDVRFDPNVDRTVSSHHAEIRFDGSHWQIVDVGSSNGTLLNGKKVQQHKLKDGDVIFFGGDAGPQVRFDLVDDRAAAAPPPRAAHGHGHAPAAPKGPDDDVMNAAAQAVAKARAERQAKGGGPSGQTMFIMLDAIQQTVEKKKHGWKKWAIIGGSAAFLVIGVLVAVVLVQNAKLNARVGEKKNKDEQISKLQLAIQLKSPDDPELPGLVAQLELLQGEAAQLTQDLASTEKGQKAMEKAGAVEAGGGDFVDRELKKILANFEANTYAIPKNFKERVTFYVNDWKSKPGFLKKVWTRRQTIWPAVSRAFAEERVPEEMAYVAWVESYFDPEICSWVGARGMWQFMPATARAYGLEVSDDCAKAKPVSVTGGECNCRGPDDRIDPYKASKAGAQYLGALLSEFGSESFMLAIASYNKGEQGMRKILRDRKLRTKAERDFWHLYYLKLLPEETMEYVPRIIAAAIIGKNPGEFGLQ